MYSVVVSTSPIPLWLEAGFLGERPWHEISTFQQKRLKFFDWQLAHNFGTRHVNRFIHDVAPVDRPEQQRYFEFRDFRDNHALYEIIEIQWMRQAYRPEPGIYRTFKHRVMLKRVSKKSSGISMRNLDNFLIEFDSKEDAALFRLKYQVRMEPYDNGN